MEYKEKRQICMHFVGGEKLIQKEELVYIESIGRRLCFHVKDEKYMAYRKLDDTEYELDDYDFLRIHQSYLVNMNFIERIQCYRVYLKTGCSLPVSKVRYAAVRERYADWQRLYGIEFF